MGNTYSSNLNNNSVLSVDDISSGKIADIHEQMYQTALRKFITVINLGNPIETFYDNYTVIETRMSDYNEASLITLIDKHTQKTVRNISLENFWPKYNYKYTSNDDIVITSTPDEQKLGVNEVEYIDYARGHALVRNTITGIKHFIPLSKIDNNTRISDSLSLSNTFTELLYGKNS